MTDIAQMALNGSAWPDVEFRQVAGVQLVEVGTRIILFSERLQQIFELNETAEMIWRLLAGGSKMSEAIERLVTSGAPRVQAEGFVASAMTEWLGGGLMAPVLLLARGTIGPSRKLDVRIGAFEGRIEVYGDADGALRRQIMQSFGQFECPLAAGSATIAIIPWGEAYFLLLDDVPLGMYPASRIVPEVKASLTDRLTQTADSEGFLLHAALLSQCDGAILLSGDPGAGKTTLAVALAARGWGYGTDDVIRVRPGLGFEAIRFSPASKSGAWQLIEPYVPALSQLPVHLRRDGQHVRYLPVDQFEEARFCRLAWGFQLARRPGACASLEPLEPLAFITGLLEGGFSAGHRLSGSALVDLIDRCSTMSCHRLVYSDLASAIALLEDKIGS